MAGDFQNLNDETVKLVAYTIVTLHRGDERILEGGQGSVIVTGRMTQEAFISYIIGRYLQQSVQNDREDILREIVSAVDEASQLAGDAETRKFADVLKRRLRNAIGEDIADGESRLEGKKYRRISEKDRKHLRVHFVVSKRWPREPQRFEEEEVEVLEEICQAIARSHGDTF